MEESAISIRSAQISLIGLSFLSILIVSVVFITGRLWHFPLDYADGQDIPLVQLTIPPFFAVLGSAAGFLRDPAEIQIAPANRVLLRVMTWIPCLVFLTLFAIVTTVFHISNQPGSEAFFSLSSYRNWITILLGLISATVPAVSAAMFKAKGQ